MKIEVRARKFGITLQCTEDEAHDLIREIGRLESRSKSYRMAPSYIDSPAYSDYLHADTYPALCNLAKSLESAGNLLVGETYIESTKESDRTIKGSKKRKKK